MNSMTFSNIIFEKKNSIAYVTVNRPKVLNALNMATMEELRAAFHEIKNDAGVRVVILTGAGEKRVLRALFAGGIESLFRIKRERLVGCATRWVRHVKAEGPLERGTLVFGDSEKVATRPLTCSRSCFSGLSV